MPSTLQRRFGDLSGPVRCAFWMVLASAAFSVMGSLIKFMATDMHPFQVAFFRCFFGLVWMLPWLIRKGPSVLKTNRFSLYLTRGGLGVVGMLSGFYAIAHLTLADVTALSFTAPLFATIGAAVILRERVRLRRWSATMLGFIGVLIILRPGAASIDPAVFLALLSAAVMAGNMLIVKSLTDTEPPDAVVTWMVILLTPATLIACLPFWVWPEGEQWPLLALLGLAGSLGHMCITRGFKAAEASLAITFEYVRMPMSAAMGAIFFGERPTIWTFVGSAIVALSSAYIAHRESTLARRAREEAATAKTAVPLDGPPRI